MRQSLMTQGASQIQYYRQVWDKQRIGTIFDKDDKANEALVRKEERRRQVEEEASKHKKVANDILEMIRMHNFRGSSALMTQEQLS